MSDPLATLDTLNLRVRWVTDLSEQVVFISSLHIVLIDADADPHETWRVVADLISSHLAARQGVGPQE